MAVNILALAGSTREGSFNKRLLSIAISSAEDAGAQVTRVELKDLALPLYDGDLEAEHGLPAKAKELKRMMVAHDGLLFASPEYNSAVSGVLKNAIDWASRPPKDAPLGRKPVGILGASPGMTGSARGQSQLRQAFEFTNSYCMPQPEILVYRAHEKFDEQGELTDEKTREYLVKYLEALRDWVKNFK